MTAVDVDAFVAAVLSCEGVSAVCTTDDPSTTGPGATASSGPHAHAIPAHAIPDRATPDHVLAIAFDDDAIEVSIVAFAGHRLAAVIERVEQAVRPLIGIRHLAVTVEDLDTGPDHAPHREDPD